MYLKLGVWGRLCTEISILQGLLGGAGGGWVKLVLFFYVKNVVSPFSLIDTSLAGAIC